MAKGKPGMVPNGKMWKMSERQMNPRSLRNLVAGKNKSPRKRKQVKLLPETIDAFEQLGNGSISDGIDKLAARLPIFGRVQLYLEQRAAEGDEQAEALLLEIESLGIEQIHEEAVAEGIIKPKGGAYIV